ncbi:MAG: response regulator transcription factor, partial [Candidatus Dormiibacterota bacterium]
TVADGGAVFGPGIARRLIDYFRATATGAGSSLAGLSERERQVLELIARGRSNEQIANALVLSPGTVRNYASSVFAKLHVANRAEAVIKAREAGLPRP